MKITEKLRLKSQNSIAEAPVKIAFLGDSVTHGCFEIVDKGNGRVDGIYDHQAVYSNRLKEKMETVFPNCPVAVINAGISGDGVPGGVQRVQRDVIDAKPDLAVVCFGLNDVLGGGGTDAYREGLRSIFRQLREHHIETIFMTPNMMCTYSSPQLTSEWLLNMGERCAAAQNNGQMDAFMQAAVEACRQEKVTLCDCYSDWKKLEKAGADITYLLANYLNHPTREMHRLFAERLFETILLSDDAIPSTHLKR